VIVPELVNGVGERPDDEPLARPVVNAVGDRIPRVAGRRSGWRDPAYRSGSVSCGCRDLRLPRSAVAQPERALAQIGVEASAVAGQAVGVVTPVSVFGRPTPVSRTGDPTDQLPPVSPPLPDGDSQRFRHAMTIARGDWRDVLVWAQLADEDWRDRLNEALR
jgi:hypothetical protein